MIQAQEVPGARRCNVNDTFLIKEISKGIYSNRDIQTNMHWVISKDISVAFDRCVYSHAMKL